MSRILGIIVILGLLVLAVYKIAKSHVDFSDPKSVSTAFLKALKTEDLSRAKGYYLPDQADAWETKTHDKLFAMQSNASKNFKESIPDEPQFTVVPSEKGSTDTTYKTGEILISLRQVDGKSWYVSKSPY